MKTRNNSKCFKMDNCNHIYPNGRSAVTCVAGMCVCHICGETDWDCEAVPESKHEEDLRIKKKDNSSIFNIAVMFFDWLYLSLSDCDGMCAHCLYNLRKRCERRKSKNQ